MNGHWLSGTRKLNKHYQSGDGGHREPEFNLIGMFNALQGFEFGAPEERYGTPEDRSQTYFYSNRVSNNAIVAPVYELWDTLPSYTRKTQRMLYGKWDVSVNGFYCTPAHQIADVTAPIWDYGEIKGKPKFAYYASRGYGEIIQWGSETILENSRNQKNKYWQDYEGKYVYTKNPNQNQRSFEDEYQGVDLDVLIPVYNLYAVPKNRTTDYLETIVMTDTGTFNDIYPNKVKVKGWRRNLQRVVGLNRGIDIETHSNQVFVLGSDGKHYHVTSGAMSPPGTSVFATYEVGVFGLPIYMNLGPDIPQFAAFAGDNLTVIMRHAIGYNPNVGEGITAGYDNTTEMVFALRLVRIEKATIQPSNEVLPFTMSRSMIL